MAANESSINVELKMKMKRKWKMKKIINYISRIITIQYQTCILPWITYRYLSDWELTPLHCCNLHCSIPPTRRQSVTIVDRIT